MQYSTLRSAYGVSGFEELNSPPPRAPEPTLQPTLQARDWTTAPPQPQPNSFPPSLRPVLSSAAPMVSLPPQGPPPIHVPSLAPVPDPIPYPSPVHVHPSVAMGNHHGSKGRYLESDSDSFCGLCKQRNDREVHLMIIYIASGIFLLLFLDTIVRLAMHLAKKR